VKPAGSVGLEKLRHGLGVGTGPVRVLGQPGSTGNRPNRSGSQRFGEPFHRLLLVGGQEMRGRQLGGAWCP
jgi:hypothetical protein